MDTIKFILIDTLKFGLPYCLLALGIFLSYRILDFADLGTEGTFTLGGAIVAVLLCHGVNPFLALLIALISGGIAGAITGVLHTKLKIPGLLSGIITMTALFSINMVIMGFSTPNNTSGFNANVYLSGNNLLGKPIDTIYTSFLSIFRYQNFNVIFISLIIVAFFIALIYWFFGTEIGMSIRSTGMNPHMSRAQGINTELMIILGLAISNALISTSGAMYAQVNKSASNTMGVGVLVIGLASIIIGESIFGKKTFKNWIISVSAGAIIYYLIIAVALKLGLPHYYQKLLYALLIVVILVLPLIQKKKNHHNVNNTPTIKVNSNSVEKGDEK